MEKKNYIYIIYTKKTIEKEYIINILKDLGFKKINRQIEDKDAILLNPNTKNFLEVDIYPIIEDKETKIIYIENIKKQELIKYIKEQIKLRS